MKPSRRNRKHPIDPETIISALIDDDNSGIYSEIVLTDPFRRAIKEIISANDDAESRNKAQRLAHTLIFAKINMAPLEFGTYNEEDWRQRQDRIVELLKEIAQIIDRLPEGIGDKNKESIEIAINRYLPAKTLNILKPENIKTLAEHDLLGTFFAQVADLINNISHEELCPGYIHVRSSMTPHINPSTPGKAGVKKGTTDANRATLIRGIDPFIPQSVQNRFALIRDLVRLTGTDCTSQNVQSALEYRNRP